MTPAEAIAPPETQAAAPQPAPRSWRKWLAVGTGVGIEIGAEDLNVTVARVRPSGVRILGSLTIHRFREQPAVEWGQVYTGFLKKLGQAHIAAHVLLPRGSVIVRQMQLPGVADKDLAAAIRYQIDSLHPFPEEDVIHDFARVGKTPSILIGISRRSVVDQYATLLNQAGIKVSAFTFSACSMYTAVRTLEIPPVEGFLALGDQSGEIEAYGESPAHPLFSARLDTSLERARGLALAELRLPAETDVKDLAGILPKPLAVPDEYVISNSAPVYATAISGACPWGGLTLNLLPAELRKTSSRYIYIPTILLAVLVLLMGIAVTAYSGWEDQRYVKQLQAEIQRIQPRAQMATAIDKKIAVARSRAQSLDNFRKRLKDDMNAVNDLSNIVVPPAWLTSLQLTRDGISISGEIERAESLLKALDGSKQFRKSEFSLPIARGASGEVFSIHSTREGIAP
jgi:Tfp pilus assembly protein PilN